MLLKRRPLPFITKCMIFALILTASLALAWKLTPPSTSVTSTSLGSRSPMTICRVSGWWKPWGSWVLRVGRDIAERACWGSLVHDIIIGLRFRSQTLKYIIVASWCLKSLETRLFVQRIIQVNEEEHIKVAHYWPFVRGIYQWPVNSPLKRPVTCKEFVRPEQQTQLS